MRRGPLHAIQKEIIGTKASKWISKLQIAIDSCSAAKAKLQDLEYTRFIVLHFDNKPPNAHFDNVELHGRLVIGYANDFHDVKIAPPSSHFGFSVPSNFLLKALFVISADICLNNIVLG